MSLSLQNVHIHLLDRGTGPATLFLHGNPDSSEMWAGVIDRLSPRLRCIAPDLPGFGQSTTPEGDAVYSLDHMAAFIEDLRLALGLNEPLNLVGHDFGGMFLLAWAIKHPAQVRRMVMMDTVFFADYRWHFWGRIWRTPVLGEMSMLTMNWPIFRWELRRGSPHLPEDHLRRTYALGTPTMRRNVLRLYRSANPENFAQWEAQLPALTKRAPLLVLWGDKDPYIDKSYAERFSAQKVIHYPNAGHWLAVEKVEEVAQEVGKWFLAEK